LKTYLENRMVQIETEMIKRHNTKMLNEMQEVVRQIKTAKTKNDDMLRDYNKKLVEVTQLIAELTEKVLSSRADLDEVKRNLNSTKQSLSAKTEQISEQVNTLRSSVLSTWQKEKTDIQNRVFSACRADLASVLSQCDTRLRDNFQETHKVKNELKRIMAKLNNEDPDSVVPEPLPLYSPPLSLDAALPSSVVPPIAPPPGLGLSPTLPPGAPAVSAAPFPTTPAVPPTSAVQPTAAAAASAGMAAATEAGGSGTAVDGPSSLAAITQQLAALAARHQQGGQPLNVATLQQFMANIPKSQQLQLQAIIQQKVQQAQAQRAASGTAAPAATNIPGLAVSSAPTGQTPTTTTQLNPNAPVFTSAATPAVASPQPQQQPQQPQQQPQQSAAASAPAQAGAGPTGSSGQVQCPFFSTFAWCKYQDKCKYLHVATGKEPLRDLPAATIAHLQQHLSPAAGQGINSEVLASVLKAAASRLQAQGGSASASAQILNQLQQAAQTAAAGAAAIAAGTAATTTQQPVASPVQGATAGPPNSATAHAMVQAQMQSQQEGLAMGPLKSKQLPCRFHAISRCAYGERCAFNHALTIPVQPTTTPTATAAAGTPATTRQDPIAAATAAAWGKTNLSVGAAAWGPVGESGGARSSLQQQQRGFEEAEDNQIVDGEDDKDYDQWNAATFGDGPAEDEDDAPPPGLARPPSNK
jgi:hypothetical protein